MAKATKRVDELLPPEEDKDVGKRVFEILEEVLDDKNAQNLPEKWNRYHELIRNKHFKKAVEVPTVSVNLCHVHQQRTVNMLTDNDPTFEVSQLLETDDQVESEEDLQAFELLQKATAFWWQDQEQQDILESSVRNGETYGIAIEKMIFNTEDAPLGEAETVVVDPFHFGWYPTRSVRNPRDIQKAAALLHYYPLPVREIKRRWPKLADKIKPDSEIIKTLKDERREFDAAGRQESKNMVVSILGKARNLFNWQSANEINEEEALVVEFWCRDYTRKSGGSDTGKEDSTKMQGKKDSDKDTASELVTAKIDYAEAKYRGNIRKVVAVNGELVLEDVSNPNVYEKLDDKKAQMTYLFDKYPFSACNSIKDSVNAWGATDLEQLEWLNHEVNKSSSQLVLEKDRKSRSKIINPKTSGVASSEFTNYHSVISPVNAEQANAIRWMPMPPENPDVVNALQLFKDLFFLIAGTFETDQKSSGGAMAGDVIAYKALAIMQERNQTMMRGKIRSYSRLVRDRGRMFISMAQNFYTEDRYISYDDENGVKIARKIKGSDMIIPCRLNVVSGSTLPTSQVQKREETSELFKLGAVDRPYLLRELGVSGRKEILDRMDAGPVGQVLSALGALGVPEPLLQMFGQVAVMDPKDIKKSLESGEIPPFQQFIAQMAQAMSGQPAPEQQIPPTEQADIAVKQAEAQVKAATVQKLMAETAKVLAENAFVAQKIESEKVGQRVAMAGVHFDNLKLEMERARTVNDIVQAKNVKSLNMPGAKEAADSITGEQPAVNKPGATARPPIVSTTPGVIPEKVITSPPPIIQDKQAKPAGYNEAGMISNNEGDEELDTDLSSMEARADGGPVRAGRPYLVGEKGPEVMMPEEDGTIIPLYQEGEE